MQELLAGLNPSQLEAVTHPGGPLLVLAGAGSGKTRVLTLRLAWLIREAKVEPWRMLAVTFTNKAAGEMKERTLQMLGAGSSSPWVSTFHSACLRILRKEADHLPDLTSDFVIYDADESFRLVKMILEEARLPRQVNPRAIRSVIDRAKNDALSPDDLAALKRSDLDPRIAEIYRRYQERLRRANAVDFGDLILQTVRLFEQNADVLERYRARFAHVMVDEYQDTNHSQYKLMRLLTDHGDRNVCVVGDEDQSIYSFRGADIRNILDFERDYDNGTTVRLERNYRSTGTILKAATAVVSANVNRLGKTLWTEAGEGDPITVRVAFDDREEALRAVEIVQRELRQGHQPKDVAIFFRTNAQSRLLEEEFIASRLPFVLVGAQRFFDRREVKDGLSYLKLVLNPNDDVALLRVLNEPPRGIGAGSRKSVVNLAAADGCSLWEAIQLLAADPETPRRAAKALGGFRDLVEHLRKTATDRPLPGLLEEIFERTKMVARYEAQQTPEALARVDNLAELKNSTADFAHITPPEGLVAWLDRVSLVADTDSLPDEDAEAAGRVTLMTVHSAKGLEFPVVIVVGMDEDVFPHFRANQAESDLEEERRLAYVAITRAEERLYLLRARRRRMGGVFRDTDESRFLRLIPRELLSGDMVFSRRARSEPPTPRPEVPGDSYVVYDAEPTAPRPAPRRSRFDRPPPRPDRPRAPAPEDQGSLFTGGAPTPDEPAAAPPIVRTLDAEALSMLAPGTRVLHPRYGEGVVRDLEGSHINPRARIQFRKGGQRLVYLHSAELEIISR